MGGNDVPFPSLFFFFLTFLPFFLIYIIKMDHAAHDESLNSAWLHGSLTEEQLAQLTPEQLER